MWLFGDGLVAVLSRRADVFVCTQDKETSLLLLFPSGHMSVLLWGSSLPMRVLFQRHPLLAHLPGN